MLLSRNILSFISLRKRRAALAVIVYSVESFQSVVHVRLTRVERMHIICPEKRGLRRCLRPLRAERINYCDVRSFFRQLVTAMRRQTDK